MIDTPTCSRPRCGRMPRSRGVCYMHLRAVAQGCRPVAAARARIAELREVGWTHSQIADAAGVHRNTVRYVHDGRRQRVRTSVEAAILSVQMAPIGARGMPTSIGLRRRVQALARMGWTAEDVAARAGTTAGSLRTLATANRAPSFRYAARVFAVYVELADTVGPSTRAAVCARTRGYPPPAAWDDDIDDPSAVPLCAPDAELVDEVAVQRVLSGHAHHGTLTEAERVRMVSLHMAHGGTPTSLAKLMGASHKRSKALIAQAVEVAA